MSVPRMVVTAALLTCVALVESNNNPSAVSPKGAIGVYQWLSSSASDPGYGVTPFVPGDPEMDRQKTKEYLEGMIRHHGFTLTEALQAYNFGPGNIVSGKELPQETIDYTRRIGDCLDGQR